MKIRVLFYKADKDGKWLDNAIAGYTGLFPCNWGTEPYSHVANWTPNSEGIFEDENGYLGKCFSSTTRGNRTGVGFDNAGYTLRHPERWDYAEMEVDDELYNLAYEWACRQVGKKYDYLGLFGFFVPFNVQDKNKWYCSEVCCWFLSLCHVMKRIKRISPRQLSKRLIGLGYEIKPLVKLK